MQSEREGPAGGSESGEPVRPGQPVLPRPDQADPATAPVAICDLCASVMVEHHCKLVCPNCGYIRDCSDP
jgi:hypothetical protein